MTDGKKYSLRLKNCKTDQVISNLTDQTIVKPITYDYEPIASDKGKLQTI